MMLDDDAFDDTIVLTRAQWHDLVGSVKTLADTNAKLLEVISALLDQAATGTRERTGKVESEEIDPYDLGTLRRMVEGGD